MLAWQRLHALSKQVASVSAADGLAELLIRTGADPVAEILRPTVYGTSLEQKPSTVGGARACANVASPSDVDSLHQSGAVVLRLHIVHKSPDPRP